MKKNSVKQYAVALHQALGLVKKESDTGAILKNFSALLAREKLLKKSPAIIKEFVKYSNEKEGIESVEVKSARPLDKKSIEAIKKYFGNKIILTEKIDTELIGGAVIKTKDYIIDGSILKHINNLKQQLI